MRNLPLAGPASPALAGPQATDDVACFDFFRLLTAPAAGGFSPSEFWARRVLQVAHAEPAVWRAAVALGALHRSLEIRLMPEVEWAGASGSLFVGKAFRCYGQALSLARSIRDPATLLVLSIVLLGISTLGGKWVDSRVHIVSAQKLLGEIQRTTNISHADVDSAAESLARMDLHAATFSDSSAPYPFTYGDGNTPGLAPAQEPLLLIENIHQATTSLFRLLRTLLKLGGPLLDEHQVAQSGTHLEARITKQTAAWEAAMASYLSQAPHPDDDDAALLSLKLYHATLRLLLKSGVAGPERRHDACLPHFERITCLSASLIRSARPGAASSSLSLEPGIVAPLYMTATRCRHPAVRRRALALLRRANRQEGMWSSIGAAAVAGRIIAVEEEGLGILAPEGLPIRAVDLGRWADRVRGEGAGDWLGGDQDWRSESSWEGVPVVPEEQRVVDSIFEADVEKGKVDMMLLLSAKEEDGSMRSRNIVVEF